MQNTSNVLSAEQIDTLADQHYEALFSAAFDPIDVPEDPSYEPVWCKGCKQADSQCICWAY